MDDLTFHARSFPPFFRHQGFTITCSAILTEIDHGTIIVTLFDTEEHLVSGFEITAEDRIRLTEWLIGITQQSPSAEDTPVRDEP